METTITPSSLEQQKPIVPVQTADNTNYQSILNDALTSLPQLQENVNTAQGQQDTAITDYLSSLNNQQSATDITAQAERANNVQALQEQSNLSTAELNKLAAQGSVLARQAQAVPLQIQQGAVGQGVTDRGVQPMQTAALRENAIKALTIASQADIVQAQAKNDLASLTNAQNKAQKAIDLSYIDQQNKLANKKANIDLISTYKLTPAQKELADAKGLQLQFAQEKLKQDIADKKQISDMVINAIGQGANDAGIDTTKALAAKTPAEAAQILGEYAGDYYKTQQLKEAIKASRTENAVKGAEADAMLQSLGILPDSQVALTNVLDAIALKESAGSGDYTALGPVVPSGAYKGQRALGRYQVMPGNLPEWSKAAVGRVVSSQEFLNSPELQDQIAGFQFLKNKQKYGTWEDAASVWFTGKPASQGASSKDVLGTTGAGYVQSFRDNLAKVVGFTGGAADNKYTSVAQDIINGNSKIDSYDTKDRIAIQNEVARLKKAGLTTTKPVEQDLESILKSSGLGEGAKTSVSTMLGVINATKDLAAKNATGELSGINPFSALSVDKFSSSKSIANRGYLDAINLKVQQWASGASLTKEQIAQVNKLVPKSTDTDRIAKTKANNLVDFMNQQIKSTLATSGTKFEPKPADIFNQSVIGNSEVSSQIERADKLLNSSNTTNQLGGYTFN